MGDDTSGGDPHDLTDLDRVGSGKAESLREAGFESVADVREASSDELTQADGIGEALAAEIAESTDDLADESDGSGADEADAEQATVQADGGEAAAEAEADDSDADDEADAADETDADDESEDEDDGESIEDEPEAEDVAAEDLDMLEVRDAVRDVAETLIEDPFDGIIEIERDEEGWYAVVEVIERSAVPDTQDILGRYEIDLDGSGSVVGYRLTDRYRRGDVSRDE